MKITVLMYALVISTVSAYGMEEGPSEQQMPVKKYGTFTDDDYTKFHAAIKTGDTTTITDYMNQGIKPDRNFDGKTALALAVTTEVKSAKCLLEIIQKRDNSDLESYKDAVSQTLASDNCEIFKRLLSGTTCKHLIEYACCTGIKTAYVDNKPGLARLILPKHSDYVDEDTRLYIFSDLYRFSDMNYCKNNAIVKDKKIIDLILAHPKAIADLRNLTNEFLTSFPQPSAGYTIHRSNEVPKKHYSELLKQATDIRIKKALKLGYQTDDIHMVVDILRMHSEMIKNPCSLDFISYVQRLVDNDSNLDNEIISTVLRHPKASEELITVVVKLQEDYRNNKSEKKKKLLKAFKELLKRTEWKPDY